MWEVACLQIYDLGMSNGYTCKKNVCHFYLTEIAKELPNDNIRQHVQREKSRPLEIGLMCPYNGFIDRSCVKIILSEAVYFLSGQHYQVDWDKLKQWI